MKIIRIVLLLSLVPATFIFAFYLMVYNHAFLPKCIYSSSFSCDPATYIQPLLFWGLLLALLVVLTIVLVFKRPKHNK